VTAPRSPRSRRLVIAIAAGLVAVAPAAVASAHTETDVVAVPAGSTATVTFEPEHGCGDSPTIDMRVQSPVAGATAVERDGWTASSTPGANGATVLQWSGGSQPADEAGAFQVRFPVPDAVGTLLVFPAVQSCANGEQEAWIETGPDAESPAPQLLVLPAGATPAATLDDVPADAPGRDLLAAGLSGEADDDDSGAAPATPEPATTAPATTTAATSTTATAATTTVGATTSSAPATTTTTSTGGGSSSSAGWIIAIVIAAVVIVGAVVAVVLRRRSSSSPDLS
jgi:periplasmic copper chaperone A